ncbi:polyubiquitin-binding protein UFD1 Ecym_1094 [Eremothecium cymbalariae DBVPG|uniref:Ubiquitin fusion degradation protein 1 n=1 Tax=Eremothecium cymbalariae (strain CBS 270.75 / DBVPG 7215 / KCTC 17166 / NRRL Y-17582) TaxID=931890 RepID=G8JME1_ERECY|nr:hypothetical protein Ecym_1094 [Eremothecium cymbalariae DBVPG\
MFTGFGTLTGGFASGPQKFEDFFRCYPIGMMNERIRKDDANYGGKIFLPPSSLNKLSMLNIRYPMLFKLSSQESGKVTHGGVLEFIAEEGRAYLPGWMMETLGVQPGSLLKIASTDMPQGQVVKIEPQSVDFLDISDPKAVLENVLRKFSTLTINDIIEISYNNRIYRIKVLEVKPHAPCNSICVIETDLVTEFAPPVGYVEPDYQAQQSQIKRTKVDPSTQGLGTMSQRINYADLIQNADGKVVAFGGDGQKLSGKAIRENRDEHDVKPSLDGKPAPLRLPDGQLFFGFPMVVPKQVTNLDEEEASKPKTHFQSEGRSLRQSNKRKGKKDHTAQRPKATRSPEFIQID